MKLDLRRYLAVVVAATISAPAMANDEYFEPSTQATPASFNEAYFADPASAGDDSCTVAPNACGEALCRPLSQCITTKPICNPYQGFSFNFESTFLKPHVGSLSVPALGIGTVTPSYDFTFTPRYVLGYEGEYGLGIRASYWSLAQSSNGDVDPVIPVPISSRTQAETIDVDITQRIVFQKWNFLVGAGLRSVNTQNTLSIGGLGSVSDSFDGWGPNILIEANRPFSNTKLSLYAGGKASLLFGQSSFDSPQLGGQVLVSNDTVFQTYQANMGLQWKGDILVSRVGLEAQIWNQGQVAGLLGLDYGYVGPTSSIGIIF